MSGDKQSELFIMKEEKPIKLSPTSLSLFRECPKCFWLHFNKKIHRPSGPFPSLPGGIDRVLKTYFDEYRGTNELPPIVADKLEGKLLDPFPKTLFYKDEKLRAVLQGKLDEALDYGDGTYAVVDHKTRGYPPKDEIFPFYQWQMDAYAFLMEKNNMPTRDTAYLAYYYPTNGILHEDFPFVVEVKPVKTKPKDALKAFQDAVALLRTDMPDAGRTCQYCAWHEVMNNLD